MHIQTLGTREFTEFQENHPLSNFYQTINYALLMAECGYDYDLVGLVNEENEILAASLILLKPIGIKCYYGYAPRGFLIDYQNTALVEIFTKELKNYYYEKNVVFIKINPNVKIATIETKNFTKIPNENEYVPDILANNGYKRLADNLYFEAQLPRFNAIVNLRESEPPLFSKNTKNKIRKGIRKGLKFEKCDKEKINIFYELMKNKKDNSEYYYQDYYTVFAKDDAIDLFLISIDYDNFLQNSQYFYNEESEKNNHLNNKLASNGSERTINAKMQSDKVMLTYKNDIMEATKGINENKKEYIAGALVIKHNKTASIIFSSYDKKYKRFAPNYFLHYNLIKYYQNDFEFLDLNGVVGNFKEDNPYSGLNRFKLSFNPEVYEYAGEYDLIIDEKSYEIFLHNGVLAKTFNKNDILKNN